MTYALMGSFMAYMLYVMLAIWVGMVACGKDFCLMISMGRTRKEFLGTYVVANLINNMLAMGAILLIYVAESRIAEVLYPGMELAIDMGAFLFDIRTIIATVLLVSAFKLLFGMLYLKFQMKMFWAVWALVMLAGGGLRMFSRIKESAVGGTVVSAALSGIMWIARLGIVMQLGLIVAVFLIFTGVAGAFLRKQTVIG